MHMKKLNSGRVSVTDQVRGLSKLLALPRTAVMKSLQMGRN